MPFWRRTDSAEDARTEWLDRVWPSPSSAPSNKPRYPIGKTPTIRSTPRRHTGLGNEGATIVELGRVRALKNRALPLQDTSKGPLRTVGRFIADRPTLKSRIGLGDALSLGRSQEKEDKTEAINWDALRPYLTGLAFTFGVLAVILSAAGFAGSAFRNFQAISSTSDTGSTQAAVAPETDSEVPAPSLASKITPKAVNQSAAEKKPVTRLPTQVDDTVVAIAAAPLENKAFYFQASFPDLGLNSNSVVVMDGHSNTLYAWNAERSQPIAGLTKLIAAMVYMDTQPNLSETVTIKSADLGQHPKAARMYPGWKFSARDLLSSIIVGSENPAVEALIRTSGVGRDEFMIRMQEKAQSLNLKEAFYYDPTGLDPANASSAEDLAKVVQAVNDYPRISKLSRMREVAIRAVGRDTVFKYRNANPLIRAEDFSVQAGKAGFTTDAGYCLAVQAKNQDFGDLLLVFLGAPSKQEALKDVERVLKDIQIRRDKARAL